MSVQGEAGVYAIFQLSEIDKLKKIQGIIGKSPPDLTQLMPRIQHQFNFGAGFLQLYSALTVF